MEGQTGPVMGTTDESTRENEGYQVVFYSMTAAPRPRRARRRRRPRAAAAPADAADGPLETAVRLLLHYCRTAPAEPADKPVERGRFKCVCSLASRTSRRISRAFSPQLP